MLKRLLFVVVPLLLAGRASSQAVWPPATFSPAAPTEHDQIRATFTVPGGCGITTSTVVTGTVIRENVLVQGCFIGPPPFTVNYIKVFGPVPANTYTCEIYFTFESDPPQLRSTQTLVVSAAPPPIPALSGFSLTVLMATLAAVAVFTLGRVAAH